MKLRYSISYFILLTSFILFFVYAFSFNNSYQMEQYASLENGEKLIINSNSDDVISEGYYLFEENGYVIVYLFDKCTLYEETDICVTDLNSSLQIEIKEGKYLKTNEELYGFLENYSS